NDTGPGLLCHFASERSPGPRKPSLRGAIDRTRMDHHHAIGLVNVELAQARNDGVAVSFMDRDTQSVWRIAHSRAPSDGANVLDLVLTFGVPTATQSVGKREAVGFVEIPNSSPSAGE